MSISTRTTPGLRNICKPGRHPVSALRRRLRPWGAAVLLGITVLSGTAGAAQLFWDNNGVGAGVGFNGASNVWDVGTTANWSPDSGGVTTSQPWTNGIDAVFQGTTGTVVIAAGGVSASSLTLSTAYTLNGGALTLSGGVTSDAAARVNAALTLSNGGTVRSNSGTLTLGSVTSGGASTTFNGGGSVFITGTLNANGSALFFTSGGGSAGFSNQITNGTALTMQATGTLTLAGANIFSTGVTIFNGFIQGGTLNVGGASAINNGGGTVNINSGIVATAGNTTITSTNGGQTLTLGGGINAQNNSLIFAGSGNVTVQTTGITNGTTLTKNGGGSLNLNAANTLAGGVTLNSGTLNINNAGALGAGAFTISGGNIDAGGSITTGNSGLNLNGNSTFGGSNNLNLGSGSVSVGVSGPTRTMTLNGNTLTLGGNITFAAPATTLTTAGNGNLNIGGTVAGNFTVGGAGTVSALAATAFGSGTAMTVNSGALELNGFNITLGSLAGSGGLVRNTATGAATLTLDGTNGSLVTYSGALQDTTTTPLALIKNGSGQEKLAGTNTYRGTTTINAGALLVDGSITSSTTVKNTATLGGGGTVGVVTLESGGTVAPGTGSATGVLRSSAATFVAGSQFSVKLNGATVGTGYDQLAVTGTCALGSATLVVTPGAGLVAGTPFTIVSATSVTGTFQGLPEGLNFTAGGKLFRINYTTTSVVLTSVIANLTALQADAAFNLFTATGQTPGSGTFSGTGVVNNQFSPGTGAGVYAITFTPTTGSPVTFAIAVSETPSLVVTTTSDSSNTTDGLTSLREALAYAATLTGSQTIRFNGDPAVTKTSGTDFYDGAARTITFGNNTSMLVPDTTIVGPGAAKLTITGTSSVSVLFSASDGAVSVSGLTLDGNSAVTSGISSPNSSRPPVTVADCVMRRFQTAPINANGAVTATGSTFTQNLHGIVGNDGLITVTDCDLSGNTGVGILGSLGAVKATRCKFDNGGTGISGGAVTAASCSFTGNQNSGIGSAASAALTDCVLSNNRQGAGVSVSGPLIAHNCTINGNGTSGVNADRPVLVNCEISNNQSGVAGGIQVLVMANCTVVGNTFSGISGGITASITNCTVTGNNVGISVGQQFTLANSIVVGNTAANIAGQVIDAGHNITTGTPAQAGLPVDGNGKAVLQNNGGPTRTVALVAGTPAIDGGDNTKLGLDPATGQKLTVTGGAGTFTLSFLGQKTGSLAFNESAANVQSALTQLSTIGGAGGTVAVAPAASGYTVTFAGSLAGTIVPLIATGSGGATVQVTVGLTTLTTDQRGQARVAGATVDIGAFEARQVVPTLQLSKGTFATNDSSTITTATPAGGTYVVRDANNAVVNGVLSGTTLSTTVQGSYTLSYTVTSDDGIPATATVPFTVVASLALGQPASIPTYYVTVSSPNAVEFPISGGVGNVTVVSGLTTLPPGMRASVAGNRVSLFFSPIAAPPTAGNFPTTVTIEDANGQRASASAVITVSADNPVTVLTPAGTVLYNYPLTASYPVNIQSSSGSFGNYGNVSRVNDNPGSGIVLESVETTPPLLNARNLLFPNFQLVPDGESPGGVPLIRAVVFASPTTPLPPPGTYQAVLNFRYFGFTFQDRFTVVAFGPRGLGTPTRTQWTVNRPGFASAIPMLDSPPDQFNQITQLTGLPNGLAGAISNGAVVISGTPTIAGSFPVTLTVSNRFQPTANVATTTFTLVIHDPPSLGGLSAPSAEVNRPYTGRVPINNGTAPFTNLTASGLPQGVTAAVSADGTAVELAGTPTVAGAFNAIQIGVTDVAGAPASGTFALSVTEPPSLVVTTVTDSTPATATDYDGQTSLREALAYAATLSGPRTVTFSKTTANDAVNFYDGAAHTVAVSTGELVIDSDVTISGLGAALLAVRRDDAAPNFRIFNIPNARTVNLGGLTISNGKVVNANGAGIRSSGILTLTGCTVSGNVIAPRMSSASGGSGAGIYSDNALTLTACTVAGNSITGFGGTNSRGGGICSSGSLSMVACTVSGNSIDHRGGGNSFGGGIFHVGFSPSAITNCTIVNNSVTTDGGDRGGGLHLEAGKTGVSHCTITGNSAPGAGGLNIGDNIAPGDVSMGDTIVAGNTGRLIDPDINREVSSLGYNLIGTVGSSTGWVASDVLNPVGGAKLQSLGNNGGPTQTVALLPGSPAIDAGDPNFDANGFTPPLTNDQRGSGFARVQRGKASSSAATVDIGAYEVADLPVVLAVTSTKADGIYKAGDQIEVTVQFDRAVTVDASGGTPTLALATGANGGAGTAVAYTSGSGTDTLTFRYTASAGENSADLDYTSTTALALNGATFTDADGFAVDFTLPPPGAAGSLGANKALVIDTTAPTIAIGAPSLATTRTTPVTFTVTYTGAETITLADGDVTVSPVTGNAAGTAAVSNGAAANQRVVTVSGFTGTGPLKISLAAGTASDLAGNLAPAAESATFAVDTSPLVADDFAFMTGKKPIDIDVLANDPAGTAGAVALTILTAPQHGTATIVNGKVHYVPNGPLPPGGDVFTYQYTDANGNLATATVTVVNFSAIAGTYDGLIVGDGKVVRNVGGGQTSHDRSGYLRITVSKTGSFSGVLTFAGTKISPIIRLGFRGFGFGSRLGSDGGAVRVLLRRPGAPITLTLHYDVANHAITGTAHSTDSTAQTFSSSMQLSAQAPAGALAGRYLLQVAPGLTPDPTGTGQAATRITAKGVVRLAGRLGDRAPFSSASLLHDDESFAIYSGLYGGAARLRGSVRGIMQFPLLPSPTGDAMGTLEWFKPPRALDRHFPAGFDVLGSATLTR